MSSKPLINESFTEHNDIASLIDSEQSSQKETAEDKKKWGEQPWALITSYFRGKYLEKVVRHQLESYNDFINFQIQKTIAMFSPITIQSEQDFDPESKKYKLTIDIDFKNFNIYRPVIHENNGATKLMFPQEARLRNFTYASSTTIDISIKYIIRNGTNVNTLHNVLKKIHIGNIKLGPINNLHKF